MTRIDYEFKLGNLILSLIEDLFRRSGIVTRRGLANGPEVLGWGSNQILMERNGKEVCIAVLGESEDSEYCGVVSVHCAELAVERVTDKPTLDTLLKLADEVSS